MIRSLYWSRIDRHKSVEGAKIHIYISNGATGEDWGISPPVLSMTNFLIRSNSRGKDKSGMFLVRLLTVSNWRFSGRLCTWRISAPNLYVYIFLIKTVESGRLLEAYLNVM